MLSPFCIVPHTETYTRIILSQTFIQNDAHDANDNRTSDIHVNVVSLIFKV